MGTDKRNRKKENRRQKLDDLAKQQQRKRTRKLATRAAIFIAVVVGVALIISVSGGSDSTSTSDTTVDTTATAPVEGRTITGDTPCPAVDGSEARASTFEKAPSNCLEAGNDCNFSCSQCFAHTVALNLQNLCFGVRGVSNDADLAARKAHGVATNVVKRHA